MKKNVEKHLADWVNGTLDASTKREVDEALRKDPELAARFHAMAELLNNPAPPPLPELEPDPFLAGRIKAQKAPRLQPQGWRQLSLSGAMLAIAITMGVFLGKGIAEQENSVYTSETELEVYSDVFSQDVLGDSWNEDFSTEGEE